MKSAALAWFSGIALFLPGAALAFQPLVTDDTGTQGAGGNQLEYAYARSVDREPLAKTVTQTHGFVYTRGVTDTLDAAVGVSRVRVRAEAAEQGMGNPVAGLKWRFYDDEASKLTIAFKPELHFPVADGAERRGLGSGTTNASATLIATRETGFGAVHANLALATNRFAVAANGEGQRGTLWRLSVAPVVEL